MDASYGFDDPFFTSTKLPEEDYSEQICAYDARSSSVSDNAFTDTDTNDVLVEQPTSDPMYISEIFENPFDQLCEEVVIKDLKPKFCNGTFKIHGDNTVHVKVGQVMTIDLGETISGAFYVFLVRPSLPSFPVTSISGQYGEDNDWPVVVCEIEGMRLKVKSNIPMAEVNFIKKQFLDLKFNRLSSNITDLEKNLG